MVSHDSRRTSNFSWCPKRRDTKDGGFSFALKTFLLVPREFGAACDHIHPSSNASKFALPFLLMQLYVLLIF